MSSKTSSDHRDIRNGAARSSVSFAKRNPARVCGNTGGVSGNLMYGFGGGSWRAPLLKTRKAQTGAYGNSASMRIWDGRITARAGFSIDLCAVTPRAVFLLAPR